MTFRQSIVLLVVLAAIAVSVGCSSSSTPPAPLTVSLGAVPTPSGCEQPDSGHCHRQQRFGERRSHLELLSDSRLRFV